MKELLWHSLSLADILGLFLHFTLLSMLSIGGAIAVAPDMHRYLVDEHHWLNDAQFTSSIALAQAAPGPNVLFVAIMGYQAAGLLGCLATIIGIMLPSTGLALLANRFGQKRQHLPSVQAFKAGLAPVTIALLVATGWLLAPPLSKPEHVMGGVVFVAAALLVWRTRLHLLWLIAAGALLGGFGLV
jgi:chromate transporter